MHSAYLIVFFASVTVDDDFSTTNSVSVAWKLSKHHPGTFRGREASSGRIERSFFCFSGHSLDQVLLLTKWKFDDVL
jgi:hypothetical protein